MVGRMKLTYKRNENFPQEALFGAEVKSFSISQELLYVREIKKSLKSVS